MPAMKLREYISDVARRKALADAIGCSAHYLYQIGTGYQGRKGSSKLAEKIEEATRRLGPAVVTKESIVFGESTVTPPSEGGGV